MVRSGLLLPAAKGLVSVSGGGDSTALLLLLHHWCQTEPSRQVRLEVLHFDHGLREESSQEADTVAALAERLGLSFHLQQGFAPPSGGRGVQATAREWRRRKSEHLLRQRQADWVATGHQREDHLETLLLKWLRGAHLSNLQGLSASRGIWRRPLLPFTADELRDYLRASGQPWLEDPSNRDRHYRRNRVRHELIPLLDELAQGALGRRLDSLARQSAQLAEWLSAQELPLVTPSAGEVSAVPLLDRERIAALPTLLATATIARFVRQQGVGAVDAVALENAARLARTERVWHLDLPGPWRLRGSAAHIWLEPGAELRKAIHRQTKRGETGRRQTEHREIGGWSLSYPRGWAVSIEALPSQDITTRDTTTQDRANQDITTGGEPVVPSTVRIPAGIPASIAANIPSGIPSGSGASGPPNTGGSAGGSDKGLLLHGVPIDASICVRCWHPGDRFQPPGRTKPLKLAEFLRARGISRRERERLPLVFVGPRLAAIYPHWVAEGFHRAAEEIHRATAEPTLTPAPPGIGCASGESASIRLRLTCPSAV